MGFLPRQRELDHRAETAWANDCDGRMIGWSMMEMSPSVSSVLYATAYCVFNTCSSLPSSGLGFGKLFLLGFFHTCQSFLFLLSICFLLFDIFLSFLVSQIPCSIYTDCSLAAMVCGSSTSRHWEREKPSLVASHTVERRQAPFSRV